MLQHDIEHCLELSRGKEAQEISKALSRIGIHYFHYTEIFSNKRISLTTSPDFVHHIYTSGLYKEGAFLKNPFVLERGRFVWENVNECPKIIEVRHNTLIQNRGGSIVIKGEKSIKQYHFAMQDQSTLYAFLNGDILHHFINYFHYQYQKLITELYRRPLKCKNFSENVIKPTDNPFNIRKIYLHSLNIFISEKEHAILKLIAHGKTAKEIAQQNFVSRRTVEAHIYSLQTKLNCKNSKELVRFFWKEMENFN